MDDGVHARRTTLNSTEVRPNFGRIGRLYHAELSRILCSKFGKTKLWPTSTCHMSSTLLPSPDTGEHSPPYLPWRNSRLSWSRWLVILSDGSLVRQSRTYSNLIRNGTNSQLIIINSDAAPYRYTNTPHEATFIDLCSCCWRAAQYYRLIYCIIVMLSCSSWCSFAMNCGFCHRGTEVENVCEKLWSVNNAKTRCAAHWNCMVRLHSQWNHLWW